MSKPKPSPVPCKEADEMREELDRLKRAAEDGAALLRRRTRVFKRSIGMNVEDTGTHSVIPRPTSVRTVVVEEADPFPSSSRPSRPSMAR